MFCSLCYSSTAWWAWGRNAALSYSPEPALPEPQEGSFDPVYRPLTRNLTLFSPHSQRTATRLFSRDTGIKTGSRTMGRGRGRKHNTESKSNSKGETQKGTHLSSGSRDALYCSGTWLHSSFALGNEGGEVTGWRAWLLLKLVTS